jgi:hypothetical protein
VFDWETSKPPRNAYLREPEAAIGMASCGELPIKVAPLRAVKVIRLAEAQREPASIGVPALTTWAKARNVETPVGPDSQANSERIAGSFWFGRDS